MKTKIVIDYLRDKTKQKKFILTPEEGKTFSISELESSDIHECFVRLRKNEHISGVSFFPALGEIRIFVTEYSG